MEVDFVPYQEASELKALGFDEECFGYYVTVEVRNPFLVTTKISDTQGGYFTFAPIFSQAFRWFREKYNIDAWVQPFTMEKSNGTLFLPDESYSYFIFKDGEFVADKVDLLDTEEAEIACLRKLIEIVKSKQ